MQIAVTKTTNKMAEREAQRIQANHHKTNSIRGLIKIGILEGFERGYYAAQQKAKSAAPK